MPCVNQFLGRADHRRPVALLDPHVAAGAGHHLAGGRRILATNDGHGREVAEDLAQCGVARCVGARDDEFDACRGDRVRGARQTGLDHRRCGEVGDVEDRAGAVADRDGLAQHAVGQPRHHADRSGSVGLPAGRFRGSVHRRRPRRSARLHRRYPRRGARADEKTTAISRPAARSCSMIRIPSGSSPQTMMCPCIL